MPRASQFELYPLGDAAVTVRWGGGMDPALFPVVQEAARRLAGAGCPWVREVTSAYTTVTLYYDPHTLNAELAVAGASERAAGKAAVQANVAERAMPAGTKTRETVTGNTAGPGANRIVGAGKAVTGMRERMSGNEADEETERAAREGGSGSAYEWLCAWIRERLGDLDRTSAVFEAAPVIEIPVCYGGAYGPDLAEVAGRSGMSETEVVELHSRTQYMVYMVGFAPGFPYLGVVPEPLEMPRRAEPRLLVPAGSVGLAGRQTGIYPLDSPGGWQIIGRTPVKLFHPLRAPSSLLQAGDRVRFVPIAEPRFEELFRTANPGRTRPEAVITRTEAGGGGGI